VRVSHKAGPWVLTPLLLLLLAGQCFAAQPTGPVSSSLVLVLKLVSAQRVRPITGIVVTGGGLVLVPADFVAEPGEIVVLDGGTDILSHGRPASIVDDSLPGGLALLSVEGLNRPGVTLSGTDPAAQAALHLEAFPPAGQIAKGAKPLWVPLENAADPASWKTPLPYVTGAIMDGCGYLLGFSIISISVNIFLIIMLVKK
jgi:hypothetical protein